MPSKNVEMDIVVEDIPPKFGVLLSRSWTSTLKGSLKMDMSYATIPMARENKRLYREKISPYVFSGQEKLDNHAIYVVDNDMGSSIFFYDVSPCDLEIPAPIKVKEEEESTKKQEYLEKKHKAEGLWTMYFDESVATVGAHAGVYIISPIRDFKSLSYKLTFECTNNVAEYESLLLGLHALKDMGSKRIQVMGDS